jgi:hypothetical protein
MRHPAAAHPLSRRSNKLLSNGSTTRTWTTESHRVSPRAGMPAALHEMHRALPGFEDPLEDEFLFPEGPDCPRMVQSCCVPPRHHTRFP